MTLYPCLTNRSVLITGGGRGFGKVFADAFAAQGANVLITGARNAAELTLTAEQITARGAGRCEAMVSDVDDWREVQAAIARAREAFGAPDILINNAARGPSHAMPGFRIDQRAPFWDADPQAFVEQFSVNVGGPFMMTKAALPHMLDQGFGRIINISTSRSTMVLKGAGGYGPSKAALEAASVVWARDLQDSGVTVNVLAPGGASDTALIPGDNIGARAPLDYRAGETPPGDEGTGGFLLPASIMAPPALFLASMLAADVNGGRFIAKDWNDALPPADAAARARAVRIAAPHVM